MPTAAGSGSGSGFQSLSPLKLHLQIFSDCPHPPFRSSCGAFWENAASCFLAAETGGGCLLSWV